MDNNIKYEILPEIDALAKAALQKTKYPFEVETGGSVYARAEGSETKYCYTALTFKDSNAPGMPYVVGVRYVHRPNRGWMYRVVTQEMQNHRARDRERRMSIETKDPARALRELRKYLKPYTPQQIHQKFYRYAATAVADWKDAPTENVYLSVSHSALIEEVKNLMTQGVTFVTEEFRKIAEKSVAAYEERKRRSAVVARAYVVYITPHEIRVSGDDGAPLTATEYTTYNSFEAMPEVLQQSVGMLRMLKDGDDIVGVGKRITETCYAVLVLPDEKLDAS